MSNEKQAPLAPDFPLGAILNGRTHMDRLDGYLFECDAGPLHLCDDWLELRRCFEHLADWVQALPAAPAPVAKGEPVAWVNEDELPNGYPYDLMFKYSKVDVVRLFPIFCPPAAARALTRLTDEEIEAGRHETFSTNNPFCPCTDKTMRKAVRWAERACAKAWGLKLATGQEGGAA